jgi:hypothetical protein
VPRPESDEAFLDRVSNDRGEITWDELISLEAHDRSRLSALSIKVSQWPRVVRIPALHVERKSYASEGRTLARKLKSSLDAFHSLPQVGTIDPEWFFRVCIGLACDVRLKFRTSTDSASSVKEAKEVLGLIFKALRSSRPGPSSTRHPPEPDIAIMHDFNELLFWEAMELTRAKREARQEGLTARGVFKRAAIVKLSDWRIAWLVRIRTEGRRRDHPRLCAKGALGGEGSLEVMAEEMFRSALVTIGAAGKPKERAIRRALGLTTRSRGRRTGLSSGVTTEALAAKGLKILEGKSRS